MVQFQGKKVAVLGLGLEGQDAARFLLEKKAKVTVFDQKSMSQLGKPFQEFKQKGIDFVLGKKCLAKLSGFEMIIRSPGFHRHLPAILAAEKKGAQISSVTKLFFDLCPGKIIGVTGTKGKGTTATLIHQILRKDKKQVSLAGNIGRPMLSLLPSLKSSSWVVLELSSFQLMDIDQSPHIGVVLFITREHLDYHLDVLEYTEAKSGIVRYQQKNDFAVLNADSPTSFSLAAKTKASVHYFSRQKKVNGSYVINKSIYLKDKLVGKTKNLKIRGQHNWENVCAASLASHLAGASLNSIKKAVFSFKGLEHRLELVRVIKQVLFFNDSFSTTPETTMAAIRSFNEPIVLIAGGSEKGSDYTQLGKEISCSTVKTLILIGEMAEKIHQKVIKSDFRGKVILGPKNMEKVVGLALKEARKGEVVLLSPGCASFDMFKNYKDRGNKFKQDVKALKS
ncbi:UDP-N-acetylmuramoyl-L-alanine--D-glutamate ligase [Patescibacteria group bacterium]